MLTYSLSNQLHEKIYFLNHMKILVANIVFFIKKNGHKGSTDFYRNLLHIDSKTSSKPIVNIYNIHTYY